MSQPADSDHPLHVGARFSAAATTYARASEVQGWVSERLMTLLPASWSPGHILDAGCGPGRVAALARRHWPEACIEGVDIAPNMIAEASARFVDDANARFFVGDMGAIKAGTSYDLVLSGSALHWLRPFTEGFGRVAGLVRDGGWLAAGVMLDGTLEELRTARQMAAPHRPEGERLPTWADLEQAAAARHGFQIKTLERVTLTCTQPDAAAMLRLIHAMGVTGGLVSRQGPPLGRRELAALVDGYDQTYRVPGGVIASFVVGYVVLKRG